MARVAFLPSAGTLWLFDGAAAFGLSPWRRAGSVAAQPRADGGRTAWIEGYQDDGYNRARRDEIFAVLGRAGFTHVAWIEVRNGRRITIEKEITMHHLKMAADTGAGSGGSPKLYEHVVEFRNRRQDVPGDAGKLSTTTHIVHNLDYAELVKVEKATLDGVSGALFALGHAKIAGQAG